eukprot:CAMPEP_0172665998 /NCGR_PEP_ID=MMETSP1074-20121228/7561_1 /TAXON_ID=2916 /ORGANISM="Ceratium fusus, Strain PA161109" /LENGTH=119 /DNA_ID=CAMNT_0013482353 /DNA_START=847 /DNA_END=1206 /DNA_ORIENTATION=-
MIALMPPSCCNTIGMKPASNSLQCGRASAGCRNLPKNAVPSSLQASLLVGAGVAGSGASGLCRSSGSAAPATVNALKLTKIANCLHWQNSPWTPLRTTEPPKKSTSSTPKTMAAEMAVP